MRITSFFIILSLVISIPVMAASNVMRCKGVLINKGMAIKDVKRFCGHPLDEIDKEHLFVDNINVKQIRYTYVTYKEGATAKYYMLFKDDLLVKGSRHTMPHA